jgi:hypothetical protein
VFSIAQQKASWQCFWLRAPVVNQPAIQHCGVGQPVVGPGPLAAGLQGTSLCQL